MRKNYSAAFKAKVVQEVLKEEKTISQIASEYGVHPTQIKQWKKTVLENMETLFSKETKAKKKEKEAKEKEIQKLYAKIGQLTTEVEWLKKNLASTRSKKERMAMVERDNGEISLSRQAFLLSVSRSSLYYEPKGPSVEEIAIKHRIDEIYTRHPYYGSRRITAQLKREGIKINRKRVQRYMREMGITAIYPGPNLSKRNKEHHTYPYLLRNNKAEYPDHVWGIDITYIRLPHGWMYLVAIIDWYSRYVVSWALDQTLEMSFVRAALKQALIKGKPDIMNSDQGSHFTSPQYIELLKKNDIKISMDGKSRAVDNIFTERFWRTLKYEEVYLHEYSSPKEVRRQISQFINFYNNERPHQALGYKTPAEVYYQKAAVTEISGEAS
ncbi:MAG: IS3 family transposase [Thermoanaerobacteraceae bacterium]|nr:IS3 family transposase [Thermoanaerobacteraceae bacterium]